MSRAEQFAALDDVQRQRWLGFGQWDVTYFPKLVGMIVDEVRVGYCRMRLPWRIEITQPAGVAHGGSIATLIDSVVVPAIGSGYETNRGFVTLDMHVQYLGALVDQDAIAEGWVTQRGRSIVFCEAEVVGASSGRRIAHGMLTYKLI